MISLTVFLSQLEQEKNDLRAKLEQENNDLRSKLEAARKGLKGNIDENLHDSNGRMNELAAKIKKLVLFHSRNLMKLLSLQNEFQMSDSSTGLKDLSARLEQESRNLRTNLSLPLSVYFDAYRTDDYMDGGEDYLTFAGREDTVM